MMGRYGIVILTVAALLVGGMSSRVEAGPWTPGPTVSPRAGCGLPPPAQTPGKEYSDHLDKNTTPAADPEQNIAWDGNRTGLAGVADTFDYTGSRAGAALGDTVDREVDALANYGDVLFSAVTSDTSYLLFSVDADPNIYWEAPVICPSPTRFGTWATPAVIDQHGVTDVDGLEVWGPDSPQGDDANCYSLEGDPLMPNAGPNGTRVSVFTYNPAANTSGIQFTTAQIAAAIGLVNPVLIDLLDLDAMMMLGSQIMFSIDPITDPTTGALVFDGGEIWVWNSLSGAPAAFLMHDGHLWNTAFPVAATFGLSSENINALEAVSTPEPSTLLLGLGALGIAVYLRRRAAR